jgi:hypothetical protein
MRSEDTTHAPTGHGFEDGGRKTSTIARGCPPSNFIHRQGQGCVYFLEDPFVGTFLSTSKLLKMA